MEDTTVEELAAATCHIDQPEVPADPSMHTPARDGLDFELLSNSDGPSSSATAAVTSRISVQKFCTIAMQFDDTKRSLARETGMGGLLGLKMIPKLNLRFSAWVMSKVDPDRRMITFDNGSSLQFKLMDMNNVFGLPCFGRHLSQAIPNLSDACIEYTRVADSMSDKGTHSLKAAEHFLLKPLTNKSTQMEQDLFKIAYVIFSVGHVLSPSSKHDYTTIDYWEALSNISRVHEYNWCEYVIGHLMSAVKKLKSDLKTRHSSIHLIGCHLFLQVFVLDNMDMGQLTRRQLVPTRISLFDYETLRKMVDALSTATSGESSFFIAHGFRGDDVGYSCTIDRLQEQTPKMLPPTVTPSITKQYDSFPGTPVTPSTTIRRCTRRSGPLDFARHLRQNYPHPELMNQTIMLMEMNAKIMSWVDTLRQNIQDDMFKMSDKWLLYQMNILSLEPFEVSAVPGQPTDVQADTEHPNPVSGTPSAIFSAPPVRQASSSSLNRASSSNNTGQKSFKSPEFQQAIRPASSAASSGSANNGGRKRIRVAQPNFTDDADDSVDISHLGPDLDPQLLAVQSFADEIVTSLALDYIEKKPADGMIIFGQTAYSNVDRLRLTATRFAREPWASGSISPPPSTSAMSYIKDWVQRAPASTLARHWVIHTHPRLVQIDGTLLLQQLIGPHPLTHEVAAVIMRRLSQIDDDNCREAVGMKWRKFMDPDFASLVLKGADPLNVQSIHEMFVGDAISFSVASCRMFYIPAILPDGWCLYLMDMLRKQIVVLDPCAGTLGHTNQRVKLHDVVSIKLLDALFRCIDRFYTNWCAGNDGWTRKFPLIMDEYFTSELSGLCMTFFAKHFDGDKLMIPLSKENLENHRSATLYDVMRMKKNLSKVPEDAIEAIKTTFFVL